MQTRFLHLLLLFFSPSRMIFTTIASACSTFLLCNEPIKDNLCKMPPGEVLLSLLVGGVGGGQRASAQVEEEQGIPLELKVSIQAAGGSIQTPYLIKSIDTII